jgi:hypothetical protein
MHLPLFFRSRHSTPLRTLESFRDLACPFPTINLVLGSKYQAARQVLVLFHVQ